MASTAAIMRAHSRTIAAFDRTYKREVEKSENMQKAMFTAINALDSYSKGVKELSDLKAFGQAAEFSYDKGTDSFYGIDLQADPTDLGKFKATEYAEEYKADPDAGMAKFGRFGDAYIMPVGGELAHVNEYEAMIIQMYGEQGEKYVQSLKEEPTINPYTGYKEYFVQELSGAALSAGISTGNPWLIGAGVVGTIGSSLFGSSKEEEAAKRQMDEISGTIGRLGSTASKMGMQFSEGIEDLFGIQEEQLSQTDVAAGESMQSLSKNVQTAIKRGKGLRTAAPEQAILETTSDIAQAAEVQKGNIITSTEQQVTQAAQQQDQRMGDISESIRGLEAEYGELEDVADQSFWDKIF
jgi:hypothetical protein